VAGAPDCAEYFSRFLRSGQVWDSEIAGDAEFSVEIGRNVWRLSALLVLANCISGKVPQGRVRLISDAETPNIEQGQLNHPVR